MAQQYSVPSGGTINVDGLLGKSLYVWADIGATGSVSVIGSDGIYLDARTIYSGGAVSFSTITVPARANIVAIGGAINYSFDPPPRSGDDPSSIDSIARGLAAKAQNSLADPNIVTIANNPNYLRWRAALAARSMGQRRIKLAIQGDSTIAGVDASAGPANSQHTNAPPGHLARMLALSGIPASNNSLWGSQGASNLATIKVRDSRYNYAGSDRTGSLPVQGSNSRPLTASGQSETFTPTTPVTKYEVTFRDADAARSWSYSIDGGAATTVVHTGTANFRKVTIDCGAAGLHTLTLAWVSGNNDIYAVDGYDDTGGKCELSVWNWGSAGATSSTMIGDGLAGNLFEGRLKQIAFNPPDLIVTEMGLVNDWNNSFSLATTIANLNTYISAVKPYCDIVFSVPPWTNSVAANSPISAQYVDTMRSVAAANGIAVIDWRTPTVSWAAAQAMGLYSVDVHPTGRGYADLAATIRHALGL